MALQNSEAKPDRAITVFAGADIDATDAAREYFTGYAPSSPAIAPDGSLTLCFILSKFWIQRKEKLKAGRKDLTFD